MQIIYIISLFAWPKAKIPEERTEQKKLKIIHWSLFIVYIAGSSACFTLAVYINFKKSPDSKLYKDIDDAWALVDGLTTCVLFLPQLYTTWTVNEIASLSVLTLGIQLPGIGLLVYFQIATRTGFTVWGPTLLSGCFQIILVVMCFYFGIRDGYTIHEILFGKLDAEESKPVLLETSNLLNQDGFSVN